MSSLDFLFAGSSDFAVPSLRSLLAAGHRVLAVLTQPDRPAGRKRRLTPTPVKRYALEQGLPVLEPVTLRDQGVVDRLASLDPDVIVVVDYGLIIPPAVLEIPRLGCINGHASLLPRWRGAAPIERAVLAGDDETGISVMQMDEGLDTGDVLMSCPTPIYPGESAGELRERLSGICATALVDVMADLDGGRLRPVPQPEAGVCYANKLSSDESLVDWTRTAEQLSRQVRAFNPKPGAHTYLRGQRLKILAADTAQSAAPAASPGTVVRVAKDGIDVATGDGTLRVTMLQPAGKRPMSAAVFANGYDVRGVTLGNPDP